MGNYIETMKRSSRSFREHIERCGGILEYPETCYILHTDVENKKLINSNFSDALEFLKRGLNVFLEYDGGNHLIVYYTEELFTCYTLMPYENSVARYAVRSDGSVEKTTKAFS